jgi:hypothetical protein
MAAGPRYPQEENAMPQDPIDTVTTSITMPRRLRVQLDVLRVARAQREGRLSPSFKAVVLEALHALIATELSL